MKRFIIKTLLFFLLVLVIDFSFGLACRYMFSHSKGGETQALNYLVKDCDKDIIIMGSSRAHCHYDDKMIEDSLGASCYNAGVEGNGIIMMYGLYKLMEHKPKLIIYDVEPSFDFLEYSEDQQNTRYVSVLKFFNADVVDEILGEVSPSLVYKNKSNLYRYNTRFITVAKDYLRSSKMPEYGFEPAYGEMKEEPVQKEPHENKIDSTKVHFLRKFMTEARKDGVELVFIASPKYGYNGSDLSIVAELCDEYGLKFYDFSAEKSFQRLDYFKEPMHMNVTGAEGFSHVIIRLLQSEISAITD